MAPITKKKIRQKTLFTIAFSVTTLMVVIFVVSWVAVMGGFEKLEKISVERNIARSQEVVADRLHNLAIKLADWTVWDDTYAFIEDKNEAYIKSNLTLLALETIKIDMMLFFNLRGELVYSNNHESDNKEVGYLLSTKFKKQLDILLTHKDAQSFVMGIVMLPEGPALMVSKPIVKSDGKGPIRGTLIFVSRLDAEEIMYLKQIIRAEMSVEKMDDVLLPSDFAAARAAFLKGKETFIDKIDAKIVAGYSILKDISGKRILILRVSMPREIVRFGVRTMGYFFVALIIVGLIFGTAVYVPLERELAGRNRAEKAAGASERKFQNLVETSYDWVWECDENGIYTYVSPRIKDLLGYEVSEVLGKTLFDCMPEEERIKIRKIFKEKLVNKETFHGLENANRHKDGHLVILETSGVPIFDEHGRVKGYRGTDRDVTVRKLMEVYREMGSEVAKILNEPGDFRDIVRRVLAVLRARTGLDAVGMRLRDGDDFPYFAQEGFPKDFLLTENTLVERDADGGICRDSGGNPNLECTCGLVISGKVDASQPFFTKGGSFWTNDSSPLLKLSSNQDPRRHPRNQCIHLGYASVALVPLRIKNAIVGLLQFNDRHKERFTLDSIERLEGIAAHIAVALMRRKAAEALQESEKRFLDILYAANDAILLIDGQKFTDCNEATAKMLGYPTRQQFLMLHPAQLSPPLQPDGEKSFEKANRMMQIAFERGFHRFEWIHRKADGTDFPVEVSLTPIVIHGKNILHCLWRDVTENKRLTEALKKSHENLENQVKERTEELVRSFQKLQAVDEELKRASKAKSEFLANMSHELRTPLNSIIGFSEVLYDERFGPLNERQKKYTQNVMASGRHLLSLINEVLDLSKVEAGKMALEASFFSILSCIEEVLRQMESQALLKKIKTALEVSEDFGKIHGDERKIKQVIYNLLSNAIKFTPPGGKVGIRGRRIDNGIEVTVWDTGIGILPENLEKAFGAFERLGSLYVQETEGTGLGLTISRKMIELHGGKIWIESGGLGKGTAVKFTIPSGGVK